MKTPSLAFLNSLGFVTDYQRVVYAAVVLNALSSTSKKVTLQPAVRANPAANPPISASPEISAPASTPVRGWESAISITRTAGYINVVASLPVPGNLRAIGAVPTVEMVGEITGSALIVDDWVDTKPSATPTTQTAPEPSTLERYLAKYAKVLIDNGLPNSLLSIGSYNGMPALMMDLDIPTLGTYDLSSSSIQLHRIGLAGAHPLMGTSVAANSTNDSGFMLIIDNAATAVADKDFDYYDYATSSFVTAGTVTAVFEQESIAEGTYQSVALGASIDVTNGYANSTDAVIAISSGEATVLVAPGAILGEEEFQLNSGGIVGIHLPL